MSDIAKKRRRPRTLTPDERHLWEKVVATAEPRPGRTPAATPVPVPGAVPAGVSEVRSEPPEAIPVVSPKPPVRTVRPTPRNVPPGTTVALSGAEVTPVGRPEPGLDRRTATRLRKGGREPDARIDLHGMTVERAHRACLIFLSDALARGCRVVLVITGKGRTEEADFMSRGRGVLRESLPGWLRASPLGRSIVGIYQAHQKHGGAGAYYIYLKRRRA